METIITAVCFLALCGTFFQLGRAYQLLVEMRLENEKFVKNNA